MGKRQPALRLVGGLDFDAERFLCSSIKAKATSTPGDLDRPFSMSQTPCGVMPISSPISESVIFNGSERKSVIKADHLVMAQRLRLIGIAGQGQIVTSFRNDPCMVKNKWPGKGSLLGQRIDFWLQDKNYDRRWFAQQVGYSYSGLSDLIAGKKNQNTSTKIASMAKLLGVNAYYLETGEGDPKDLVQPAPPVDKDWPFQFDPILVFDLNQNERELLGERVLKSINEIRSGRTKARQRRKEADQ